MKAQVEILFPIMDVDDPPTRAWFVDGGMGQGYGPGPTAGTVAPNALPHMIGTDRNTFTSSSPPSPPSSNPTMAWTGMQPNYQFENVYGVDGLVYTPVSPQPFDKLGNFVTVNGVVSGTDGSTQYTLDYEELWDAIDAWYGSALVVRTPDIGVAGNACTLGAICGGKYILAYAEATSPHDPTGDIFKWFALLDPQSSAGTPTVLGAIGYNTYAVGLPYLTTILFSSTGAQSDDDPLIVIGGNGFGGDAYCIGLLPSPNDIKNGTYRAGFSALGSYGGSGYAYGACEVPYNYWYPIGNTDLSTDIYAGNATGAFALPNSGGGTNVYFYLSEPYIAYCVGHAEFSTPNPEIENVIGPAYPNGAMVKITLSTSRIDFASITRTPDTAFEHDGYLLGGSGGSTGMYAIDNTNWGVPFTDENTYISQSGPGSEDTTGQGTLTTQAFLANQMTVLGTIFASRTGSIEKVTVQFASAFTGHAIMAIYEFGDDLFNQVGVTSNVVTNPGMGNQDFTFGTAVPVTYNTQYIVMMLADGAVSLNGSAVTAGGVLVGGFGIIGSTNSQPYSSGFATPIDAPTNGTTPMLPWVHTTYTNAPALGSDTGYNPMPSISQSGSDWQIIMTMFDTTNSGWASARVFSYASGTATQTAQIVGPVYPATGIRGQVGTTIVSGTPYFWGFQNAYLGSGDDAGQVFKTGMGVLSTVDAKTIQPVTFDGSTSITLVTPSGLPTDTGSGTLSFWYNPQSASEMMFLSGTDSPVTVSLDGDGNIVVVLQNSTKSCTWSIAVADIENDWNQFLLSWNVNLTLPYLQCWQIGDSSGGARAPTSTTGGGGPFLLDYAGCTSWNFFGPAGAVSGFDGYAGEFWFAPGIEFGLPCVYEYQNFAGPGGAYSINGEDGDVVFPADLGTHGELPLSGMPGDLKPFVYLAQNPGFATNLGYGGTTTASGSLADAPSAPF